MNEERAGQKNTRACRLFFFFFVAGTRAKFNIANEVAFSLDYYGHSRVYSVAEKNTAVDNTFGKLSI